MYIFSGGSKQILSYEDIDKFRQECGSSSVMIARAAEWNPSIFRPQGKLDLLQVVREYLRKVSKIIRFIMKKLAFCLWETKAQISCVVTAQLISAFVFPT